MSRVCLFFMLSLMSFANLCFSATPEAVQMTDQPSNSKNPVVLLKTNKGDIKIELYADKAPITVKNFLQYVNEGHFNGTIFHRVIEGFMVQGGGFTQDMQQKQTHAPIKNEADNGLSICLTVAMARTSDVNSASAQFFINVVDNPFLDFKGKNPREYGYCVFGKVTEGMDVIDQIRKAKTGTKGPFENVPVDAIVITDAKQIS